MLASAVDTQKKTERNGCPLWALPSTVAAKLVAWEFAHSPQSVRLSSCQHAAAAAAVEQSVSQSVEVDVHKPVTEAKLGRRQKASFISQINMKYLTAKQTQVERASKLLQRGPRGHGNSAAAQDRPISQLRGFFLRSFTPTFYPHVVSFESVGADRHSISNIHRQEYHRHRSHHHRQQQQRETICALE